MKNRVKKKVKKKKMASFIVGATVGTVAGILLAKKPGDELMDNIGENLEVIKKKAKDAYDNKEEIIDNMSRNIKKITNSEIKNFIEPKYYAKVFDTDGKLKENIRDMKEDVEEFIDEFSDKFENQFKKTKKEVKKIYKKT